MLKGDDCRNMMVAVIEAGMQGRLDPLRRG